MLARREAQASEVAVHVAHRPAPGAQQVMVGAGRGFEASRACPHVELLDLTQRYQVVESLVDGAQRDRRHLLMEGLENRMGRRMGAVAVQDPEDALALGCHLEAPISEQLSQLGGRLHRCSLSNNCGYPAMIDVEVPP